MREVLDKLGLAISGGSYSAIKKHMIRLGLKFELTPEERQLVGIRKTNRYTDSEIFSENSEASTTTVKARLLRVHEPHVCSVCKLSTWMGKDISLHMDHIN